jgi:ribosomal protein S18 acetylase RimI-like enzyme
VTHIELRPVTLANRGDLDDIDPGDPQRYWVHSNWYWHQQSLDNPNITFRLVHVRGQEAAVGMVAWGPMYLDEALTDRVQGAYEITHLVLDRRHQRQGIGAAVARKVLAMLLALPDCEGVVVAVHPDNAASASLFRSLGFVPADMTNYDGDPMLVVRQAPGA